LLDFVMTPGEQQDRGTKTTGESAAGK